MCDISPRFRQEVRQFPTGVRHFPTLSATIPHGLFSIPDAIGDPDNLVPVTRLEVNLI